MGGKRRDRDGLGAEQPGPAGGTLAAGKDAETADGVRRAQKGTAAAEAAGERRGRRKQRKRGGHQLLLVNGIVGEGGGPQSNPKVPSPRSATKCGPGGPPSFGPSACPAVVPPLAPIGALHRLRQWSVSFPPPSAHSPIFFRLPLLLPFPLSLFLLSLATLPSQNTKWPPPLCPLVPPMPPE